MAMENREGEPSVGHAIVVRNFRDEGFKEIHLAAGESVLCLTDGSIVYSNEKAVTEDLNRLQHQTELLAHHFLSGGLYFSSPLLGQEGAIGANTPHQQRLFPIRGPESLFIVGWDETEEMLKVRVREELKRGKRIFKAPLN
ncbi:MAG TPA: hypothetical protein VMW41_03870 [Candidatus Bathyarchaeia archaeon]|nr:hypothetical protein [Candidatus Bathyarchaeia archaeon]